MTVGMIEGIDVSHHQATTPNLAGLDFLFARATYGVYPDSTFAMHVGRARAAGLVTAGYHFGRHGDVGGQVAAFLDALETVRPDKAALDVERDEGFAPMTDTEARDFITAVEAAGWPCGLYASSLRPYPNLGQSWRWVADYRVINEPPIPWDVWQWTSSGGRLDRDRFRGSAEELRSLGGHPTVAISDIDVADADVQLVDLAKGIPILNIDGSARTTLAAARTGVLSPFGSTSGGGTALRAIVYGRPAPAPDLLLAVYAHDAVNRRPATPAADCAQAIVDGRAAEHELVRAAAIAAAEAL